VKLYLSPVQTESGNGIGQVILAQHRYLPDYGFEFVDNPDEADIKAAHIWSPLIDNHVLHLHGLEWNGDRPGYEPWHGEANQAILETAKLAWAITVPSEWVAMPFKRDMRLSPTVIGHGLHLDEWGPLPVAKRGDYLLWNKNRADIACSPQAAIELAGRGLPVTSTFGDSRLMRVTGPVPHAEMKELLAGAGVYLSTARETFGIGILEALACGVPVLGYAYGGILDLVQHKVNGYLVEPGDISGLEAGYKWLLEHREEMQPAVAASVEGRDWKDIIGQYARLYQEVYERKQRQRKVSVVITNHNYSGFVIGAINSALDQSLQVDEIIVVDDGSTDNSQEVLRQYDYPANIQFINQSNQGVAAARNNGIASATGDYIICLDADDWLEPTYVETCFKAMEADRALGIAYTGLKIHFDSGDSSVSAWPPKFDFNLMAKPGVPPPNCVPCAAMFRRDMWERAGGYRQEYAPGEDTEFWLRGLSVGFNAKRVTSEPLFNYRMHGGSASRTKTYIDITEDKPWCRDRSLMPIAAPTRRSNLVRSYSEPLVSVIIPVGPGHAKHLNKALDSLMAQTFKGWEVWVVYDLDGADNEEYMTFHSGYFFREYPFCQVVRAGSTRPDGKSKGAGVARNKGIAKAKAPLLFFLDADDWLLPTALEKMVRAYTKSKNASYVFTDWYKADEGKPLEAMNCSDYNQEAVRGKIQHAVSVLVETEAVRKVGGFDESLPTWEDWDFFIRLAASGYCGVRVPEPLLVYRTATGTRRLKAYEPNNGIFERITGKWKGVSFMACCGQNQKIERQAVSALDFPTSDGAQPDGTIKMRFVGSAKGTATYFKIYEAANDGVNDTIYARPEHVNGLLQTGLFVQV
jgi:glycosyltransferase involved in cell wall biosynthesis